MTTSSNTKQFNEKFKIKHFNVLQSTFWDSKEKIKQNYDNLNKIIEENNKKPKEKQQKIFMTSESLKESYNFLTKEEERENYLSFLKYYYFLSEPLSLSQLKKNYNNILFPYYLFTIKIKEKQQISTLIIDFIEKNITIFYKDKEFYKIKSDNIISINKKLDSKIIINVKNENYIKNRNRPKDEVKEIAFEPEFNQQVELIYIIISYLAKTIENKNKYDILEDDSYRPFGIILRTNIIKEHRIKVYGKDERYAILGTSMIIIYKNEEMKDIRNVLPLYPFFMRISFIDKEKKIILKYPTREQALSLFDNENYTIFKTTLKDIFNGRIKSSMNTKDYYQAKENKEKEKIIKEIDNKILSVKDEMKNLKIKLAKTNNNFLEKIKNK